MVFIIYFSLNLIKISRKFERFNIVVFGFGCFALETRKKFLFTRDWLFSTNLPILNKGKVYDEGMILTSFRKTWIPSVCVGLVCRDVVSGRGKACVPSDHLKITKRSFVFLRKNMFFLVRVRTETPDRTSEYLCVRSDVCLGRRLPDISSYLGSSCTVTFNVVFQAEQIELHLQIFTG